MKKHFTYVDAVNQVYLPEHQFNGVYRSETGAVPFKVTKRRLHGGVQDGIDVVEIDSGRFVFTVALTRGMNVLCARCDDLELKWDSPVGGPVHPKFVPLFAPNGCGWLEGFSEWIARCGLESNGAPEFNSSGVVYPLHGRIANLPARKAELTVDEESGVIELSGDVREVSFFGHNFLLHVKYSIEIGSTKLRVEDSITNLSSMDDEFELLYHINTGNPLVGAGSRALVPFKTMCPRDANAVSELPEWDRFVDPVSGRPETCYFFDLATDSDGKTKTALFNRDETRGVALSFNKSDFPYFILWKTQRPNEDIYVSGMEPAVNFPNTRSFEKRNGRVVAIQAKETRVFSFELEALVGADATQRCAHEIAALQKNFVPEIQPSPNSEWCE